ncbi:MAG: PGPGW domain-containing protein [Candidatus Acidiferrales bacterium]
MIKTLQQAKRFLTILFGFTLLILGIAMLVLPGPGLITIALALGILAAEYLWARRLLDRLKLQGDRLRNSIFQRDKPSAAPSALDKRAPDTRETSSASSSSDVAIETHVTIEPIDADPEDVPTSSSR